MCLLLFTCLLFFAFADDIDYTICLDDPTQTKTLFTRLQGYPWPPQIGQTFQLSMEGVIDTYCEEFLMSPVLSMKMGPVWVDVPLPNKNLCNAAVRCPVIPGPLRITFSMPIPSMSPAGTYKGEFSFKDGDRTITCLGFMLELQ